jgi:hypothetical protein
LPRILSETEIGNLLVERKPLPHDWQKHARLTLKANFCHKQRDYPIEINGEKRFVVSLRQSVINQLDFSIILIFIDQDGTYYRLIRHNGKHPSDHTNKIEKTKFRNVFHIHRATERYQMAGYDIDGFATETTLYASFATALQQFIDLYGFEVAPDPSGQASLIGRQQ